ncbi:DUF481 domain-containing protein [Ketogulonicigenium vulgare]|uniref:Salt-stress induced outer membrane protein n=1 Tax=Ketogulonicigenium vulgare (strain WSH-001) TaxID=759362 RepID=F9Y4C5_KETVW|nr:DUF481 domain-containing protein [Ketogulonicigenium vulgare]ADO43455.1 Salt-stress induced outer membrane protein [Ketogulonicigenium vulgare Y25]AEM41738.1 Salt-stress induced outer membrane protein [Ketogulonicigenium vulgare WSH-001]ALJ81846.1 hypothetical protein KVH_12150 [Ketogulonicigenium vulgare]ANW34500.1 hypothetical protein KvSKV_12065 [Ketogulonicigenium vulgare]AOZ55492.1 Salt-stress induced outer membrane protein [Ketogulonicigenium vulgare]
MQTRNIFVIAAIAAVTAAGAQAQTSAFANQDRIDDTIEDLRDDIADDFDRDVDAFGNEGRALGFTGSLAARANVATGNSESTDVGVGGNFGYFDGINGHAVALSYAYSEDSDAAETNRLMLSYDYTRELSSSIYAYGKGIYIDDKFGSYTKDTFVGAGLGYRIFNDPAIQWSIAAGPGFRWADVEDGSSIEEVAVSISSDYYYRLSETLAFTNDTDVIWSESDTYITNDLGLTVSMTDSLALRGSIFTQYHTDPLPGYSSTDNTYGLSVVYSF